MKKIIKNIVPTSCKECKFYKEYSYVTSEKNFISKKKYNYIYKNVIKKDRYCGKRDEKNGWDETLKSLNVCLFFKPSKKTINTIEKLNKKTLLETIKLFFTKTKISNTDKKLEREYGYARNMEDISLSEKEIKEIFKNEGIPYGFKK